MNNHDSHVTSESALLADENHIRPYSLISHLTHCIQPLDVEIFQPYKHWYNMAIQNAMTKFNLNYSTVRFCEKLIKIRDNRFKKSMIQFVFEKCGMYSVDSTKCIAQLRKFVPNSSKVKSRKDRLSLSTATALLLKLKLPRLCSQTLHKV